MGISYVRQDEQGVYRVGDTRVMLDSVVAGFHQGLSAEAIQCQYPDLTLEQVYGAIAYYLGHQDEVDAYLDRQEQLWTDLRRRSLTKAAPVVQRLRALKAQTASARGDE